MSKKVKRMSTKVSTTDSAGLVRNYLSRDESNWLVVLFVALLPPLGVYLVAKHRPNWLKNNLIILLTISWLAVWIIMLFSSSYNPPKFDGGQYSGGVIEIEANHDESDKAGGSDLPQAESPDQAATGANQSNANMPTENNQPTSTATDVRNAMAGVAIAAAENVAYNRDDYQPDWSVGSGCDIRSRVLTSLSQIAVQYGTNGCTVKYGSWVDPYTGQTLTGNPYRGDGTSNDLDIDHIIPLKYVNEHGGAHWSAEKKRSYGASLEAMNNGVYVAVSASENRRKSDSGPSEYYPPNQNYRCEYARKWRDIARLYGISLTQADYNVVSNTLANCGIN